MTIPLLLNYKNGQWGGGWTAPQNGGEIGACGATINRNSRSRRETQISPVTLTNSWENSRQSYQNVGLFPVGHSPPPPPPPSPQTAKEPSRHLNQNHSWVWKDSTRLSPGHTEPGCLYPNLMTISEGLNADRPVGGFSGHQYITDKNQNLWRWTNIQ